MGKLKDLTGKQFGDWHVIERDSDYITESGNKFVIWKCKCKCGNIESVWASNLIRGASTKCKDCVYQVEDLTGKRFGRLTVIERKDKVNNKTGKNSIAWICKCDCGNESWVRGGALKSKNPITSCGCRQKEGLKARIKKDRISYLKSNVYKDYKNNARKRNLSFDLTLEEFNEIINKPCYYCGASNSNQKKDMIWKENKVYAVSDSILEYNGIDRVDSTLGYSLQNCVPCCCICNKMKNNYPLDIFVSHINKISDYMSKKN